MSLTVLPRLHGSSMICDFRCISYKEIPKADKEAQERWLTQELPEIKKSEEGKGRSAVSR